ncbi:thioester domain-containing protein [Arcanobacterium hippocoleae]
MPLRAFSRRIARIFTILLAALLAIAGLPSTATAADEKHGVIVGEAGSWYPYFALSEQEVATANVDPIKIRYKLSGFATHWVYCINSHIPAPDNGEAIADKETVSSNLPHPYTVFKYNVTDLRWIRDMYFANPHDDVTTAPTFEAQMGVAHALYRGFPNDGFGLKAKYNLSDWEFYALTQYAVHFWTDSDVQGHMGIAGLHNLTNPNANQVFSI